MNKEFICKIPSLEEMHTKWDYEIEHDLKHRDNWIVWKKENIDNFQNGSIIPYYGFLDGTIICEATAMLKPEVVQNSDRLVDDKTVYLSAFRTIPEYQGQGYFSKLFKYMLSDLQKRGYTRVTLGVEPHEEKNRQIYKHYGFDEYIKKAQEFYPDGTAVDVLYYGKNI